MIKTNEEIELLKNAGLIVGETHNYLKPFIKEGITTKELDELAHEFILSKGATCSFLNYSGYPASICTSINEEVVHGIPSSRKLKNGDIILLRGHKPNPNGQQPGQLVHKLFMTDNVEFFCRIHK